MNMLGSSSLSNTRRYGFEGKLQICFHLIVIVLLFPSVVFSGNFKVVRVYDGDSFKAVGHDIEIQVRLVGIDAPENSGEKPQQPFSKQSKEFLENLILGKTIEIKGYGMDRYHRILGVVFVHGKNLNIAMLGAGLAEVYRGRTPKSLDVEPFRKAENEAKRKLQGIWSLGDDYVPPREWRKMDNGSAR